MKEINFHIAADTKKCFEAQINEFIGKYNACMKKIIGEDYIPCSGTGWLRIMLNVQEFSADSGDYWYSEDTNETYAHRLVDGVEVTEVANGHWLKTDKGWEKVEKTV